jgi:hypothetical protein
LVLSQDSKTVGVFGAFCCLAVLNDSFSSMKYSKSTRFCTVFSLFHTENCVFFCVFPKVFFPPRQERTRIMYIGKYGNRRRIWCICNRLTVFLPVTSVFFYRNGSYIYSASTQPHRATVPSPYSRCA